MLDFFKKHIKSAKLATLLLIAFFSGVLFSGIIFTFWVHPSLFYKKQTPEIEIARLKAAYTEHKPSIHKTPTMIDRVEHLSQKTLEETLSTLKKEPSYNKENKTIHKIKEWSADAPKWQKNGHPTSFKEGYTPIAIVIDDVGVVRQASIDTVKNLPKEITLSFLPYGESTQKLSHLAYKMGHEIMIHLPMEPLPSASGYVADPGPNALFTYMSAQEIEEKTQKNINTLKDIAVGVNNHMGSAFTEWEEGLNHVMRIIEDENLMFMDSVTTAQTKVAQSIQNKDIPFLKRHVFLDHSQNKEDIKAALEKTVRIAKKQGSAIAIGHPHPETLEVLKEWIPSLEEKHIQLIPITTLIQK